MALAGRRYGSYDSAVTEAIAFDTHRFVKRLTDCGFTEQQAETLADEHVALLNANLATKADVARIEERIAKIEAGMEALRQETKTDIAKVETRMEAIKFDLTKRRRYFPTVCSRTPSSAASLPPRGLKRATIRRDMRARYATPDCRVRLVLGGNGRPLDGSSRPSRRRAAKPVFPSLFQPPRSTRRRYRVIVLFLDRERFGLQIADRIVPLNLYRDRVGSMPLAGVVDSHDRERHKMLVVLQDRSLRYFSVPRSARAAGITGRGNGPRGTVDGSKSNLDVRVDQRAVTGIGLWVIAAFPDQPISWSATAVAIHPGLEIRIVT